jgi:hypothetical protein
MMKIRLSYIILVLPFALFTISCLDNFNRDLDTVYYNPSYSVPIGPLEYSLGQIMPPEALIPLLDTSFLADTIPLIVYNDSFFFINPKLGYDTTFIEPVNLDMLGDYSDYIVSLMIRSNITNNIPTELSLQIYLLDGDNNRTDSVYKEGKVRIRMPDINQEGVITEPYFETIDTYLDQEEIDNLLQTSAIESYIYLKTYDGNTRVLHVWSSNGIGLQLAIRAEILAPL